MTFAEKVQIGIRCCHFGYNSSEECANCPYRSEAELEICSIALRRDLDKILNGVVYAQKKQNTTGMNQIDSTRRGSPYD